MSILTSIADMRQSYRSQPFDVRDVDKNPFTQFKKWFENAVAVNILEPNAMTLATANAKGQPSARVVLLKGYDEQGFTFYTNYNSQKGHDISVNPNVALVFAWLPLARQIRIEGRAAKIAPHLSDAYFQSRPKKSQIGAWASPQSQVITSRQVLEDNFQQLSQQYAHVEKLERPPHWGGYRVVPHLVEFWQGRPSRLHDRIGYRLENNGNWNIERLAP